MKKLLFLLVTLFSLTSCVHEFPEVKADRQAVLHVHFNLEWTFADWTWGRGTRSTEGALVRYIYEICPTDQPGRVVARYTRFSRDLTLADFTTPLEVPAGDYTLWMWVDYCEADEVPFFYDAENFAKITLLHPDVGNDARKDAFVGHTKIEVPKSDLLNVNIEATIDLNRPLAAYAVIATDYDKFMESESRRRGIPSLYTPNPAPLETPPNRDLQSLEGYQVRFNYTGYLPSVFNAYTNRPVDVVTGAWFDSEIQGLNNNEALLGFDFIIVNGHESAVTVSISTFGPDGTQVATTGGFNIPLERSRVTIVKGPFLTSNAHAGVGINAEYDGVHNIEIK